MSLWGTSTCNPFTIRSRRLDRLSPGGRGSLKHLYPLLDVYVQVSNLRDKDELLAKGIEHAGTGYIESTLVRGSMLLKDIGTPEADVRELVEDLQRDDYSQLRSAYARTKREQ